MKKISVVVMAMALVMGWGISTACAERIYVSGNLGMLWLNDSDVSVENTNIDSELSFDQGYAITAAIGNDYKTGVRSEFEVGYRTNDMDQVSISGFGTEKADGEISTLSFMANAFFDFMPQSVVSPFVGAGIGYASVKADADDYDDSANVFAYQAAAGVTFSLSKEVNIDLQYRYFATTDPEFDSDYGDIETEYSTHNAMLGLRYTF